jgi:hypothetical protein
MEARSTTGGFELKGRIDTKVHDESSLREVVDDYDSLSREEKLELTREVEPEYEDTVYNVTTDSLHQYFVDNLDSAQTDAKDNVSVSHLGLGDDGTSGTSTSDTDLNNRVYNESVTDVADNGKELLASTFIDSTEANGNTLDELGLFSGDPANLANDEVFLMNHATFADVTKDNTKTVTFDVTLQFSDV